MAGMVALNVLVAHHSATEVKALADALPSCRLQCVKTISAALKLIAERDWQLIFLDISLPGMERLNGFHAIRQSALHVPLILLAGREDEGDALLMVQKGAQDYILKGENDRESISRVVQYSFARKQFENDLVRSAHYDPLTGLSNRILFEGRLDMAIARSRRSATGVGVLFLDLDSFKSINDTMGHAAGDTLLRQVAERLRGIVRVYDTPARFGGDEFAVLVENIQGPRYCSVIAGKIISCFDEPFTLEGKPVKAGVSIGIAVSFGQDEKTREELLRQADAAMYMAKQKSGSQYRFYTTQMQEQAQARSQSEMELRGALYNNQLELYYQPKLDVATGRVTGAEAFIRWNHAKHGVLAFSRFMSIAEESGMVKEIGQLALTSVCMDMEAWRQEGRAPLQVAVNISDKHLDDKQFVEFTGQLLERFPVARDRLVFEISSASLLEKTEGRMACILALKRRGVLIHLDHFGTKPFSLATMQDMVLDALKIDSDIVNTLGKKGRQMALVKAIIALAHKLDIKVIASGVENKQQQTFLQKQFCNEMQGFLFKEPMPERRFSHWLQEQELCAV